MAFKKFGKMKVYNVSGYNYKDTPTIILSVLWRMVRQERKKIIMAKIIVLGAMKGGVGKSITGVCTKM